MTIKGQTVDGIQPYKYRGTFIDSNLTFAANCLSWLSGANVYHVWEESLISTLRKSLCFYFKVFFLLSLSMVMVWICVCKEQILTNSVYLLNGLIDWLVSHSWTQDSHTGWLLWFYLTAQFSSQSAQQQRLKNSFVPVISQKSQIVIYLFIMMHCLYLLSVFV